VTAEEDPAQVRVDHLVPRGGLHVGHLGEEPDAGVVDQDVETAEPLGCRGDRGGRLRLLPDVGTVRVHTSATVLRLPRQRRAGGIEVSPIAARDDHAGAGVHEGLRDRETDAPRAPGDESNTTRQIERLGLGAHGQIE
jgi:hypothetical protein